MSLHIKSVIEFIMYIFVLVPGENYARRFNYYHSWNFGIIFKNSISYLWMLHIYIYMYIYMCVCDESRCVDLFHKVPISGEFGSVRINLNMPSKKYIFVWLSH